MARTESVADFELLAAGPGGVVDAQTPPLRVADGERDRRGRRGAAHDDEQRDKSGTGRRHGGRGCPAAS